MIEKIGRIFWDSVNRGCNEENIDIKDNNKNRDNFQHENLPTDEEIKDNTKKQKCWRKWNWGWNIEGRRRKFTRICSKPNKTNMERRKIAKATVNDQRFTVQQIQNNAEEYSLPLYVIY